MAKTQISDVIVPEVFNPYFIERTAEIARFYMGGIVSNDAELNRLATAGGKLINMPFWNDLTGEDEILSDSGALTPAKIDASQDVAALHTRGKAWSVNDLAKALGGDDPMGAIAELVADFWARRRQAVLLASLKGVMADNTANDDADMVAGDGTGAFDADLFIDGQKTFGDALGGFAGLAVHSDIYYNLRKIDNISFEKESDGALDIETYRGLRIIRDDQLAPASGVYTSYVFGQGAIGMGNGAAPVPSETDRDSLAGDDILVTRDHFVMHPRGVAFTNASVASTTPSNTELESAANWDRVYERKNVRVASILSNG